MPRATPIRLVVRGFLVAGATGGVAVLAAGQPPASPRLATPPALTLAVPATPAPPTRVDDFVRLALERNPRLGRAAFAIDAARGRYVQAGLYPNPVLSITGDELGDRQGPGGIWTAPQVNQELVTGRKLTLSQAVAAREVDRAALDLLSERYALVGAVRSGFYEVYTLQRRAEILAELVKLAGQSVELGQKQLELKQVARLDVIQLEVELERFRAEFESVERELPAAFRRLAAVAGDPRLPVQPLAGAFDAPLPSYDHEATRETVLALHPEVRAAKVAAERAQFALRRAQAEPIPNVTLSSGYVRQNQNRSDDWMIGVSMPIPLWNRNQGNIRAAQAEIGVAVQDVGRVENDVAERLATAFRTYESARQRAERYKTSLLPRAEETYELSLKAFKGGQFEYLRVLQAQRAVAEARLEYNRALGEAWRAAGEISGLLLEEVWPPMPPAPAAPVVVPPALPAPVPMPKP